MLKLCFSLVIQSFFMISGPRIVKTPNIKGRLYSLVKIVFLHLFQPKVITQISGGHCITNREA